MACFAVLCYAILCYATLLLNLLWLFDSINCLLSPFSQWQSNALASLASCCAKQSVLMQDLHDTSGGQARQAGKAAVVPPQMQQEEAALLCPSSLQVTHPSKLTSYCDVASVLAMMLSQPTWVIWLVAPSC